MDILDKKLDFYMVKLEDSPVKPNNEKLNYCMNEIEFRHAGDGDYLVLIAGIVCFEIVIPCKRLYIFAGAGKKLYNFNVFANQFVKRAFKNSYDFFIMDFVGSYNIRNKIN